MALRAFEFPHFSSDTIYFLAYYEVDSQENHKKMLPPDVIF